MATGISLRFAGQRSAGLLSRETGEFRNSPYEFNSILVPFVPNRNATDDLSGKQHGDSTWLVQEDDHLVRQ